MCSSKRNVSGHRMSPIFSMKLSSPPSNRRSKKLLGLEKSSKRYCFKLHCDWTDKNLKSISLEKCKGIKNATHLYYHLCMETSQKKKRVNVAWYLSPLWTQIWGLWMDHCYSYGEWLQSWKSWLEVNDVDVSAHTEHSETESEYILLCTLGNSNLCHISIFAVYCSR